MVVRGDNQKGAATSSSCCWQSNTWEGGDARQWRGGVKRLEPNFQLTLTNPKSGPIAWNRDGWFLIPKLLLIYEVFIILFNKFSCIWSWNLNERE